MNRASLTVALVAAGIPWVALPVGAQTDFHNLDKHRPLRVEDALSGKRGAFELQTSPLVLAQDRDGVLRFSPSLELKHGILPGLDLGLGWDVETTRTGTRTRARAGAAELSALLNLRVEGPRLPAAALRVTGRLPTGGDGDPYMEVKGILTRSVAGPVRLHMNGAARVGDGSPGRWWAGGALDHVLPFRHLLLLAEAWVEDGGSGNDPRVHTGAGFRFQLSPSLVLDAGVGRDWKGDFRRDWALTLGVSREFGVRSLPGRGGPSRTLPAGERVYHPFHLPAGHNWTFRETHPSVDRLFNAFDYGHGILYETLWNRPGAPPALLEEEIFHRLTGEILLDPPRLPMPEAAFMPRYARLVPRAREMFEWAHVLHRQSYDILADASLSEAERDRAMAELLRHYRSSDLAFPVEPKGMAIMDEQRFSKTFRERYPRFNGLIWAYHWLQVAVYEPLLAHDSPAARQAAVQATLARFWQMVEGAPGTLPSEMPMTPAIAPLFTERYPEFAAIFDNLHMMHDVISDILTSEGVERSRKRNEIYRQTDLFRDPAAMAVTVEEWIAMALAHGVDAQGGPATGWLPPAPTGAGTDHRHHDEEGGG